MDAGTTEQPGRLGLGSVPRVRGNHDRNFPMEIGMHLIDQLAPGLSGLEAARVLIAAGGRPRIGETLQISFIEAGDGWAVFEAMPGVHAYNTIGTAHGGYAATMLDSACGSAIHTKLTADQIFTTLELKVSYLRPITSATGKLRAEGRAISVGRRAAFAEASLMDENRRIHATATSTLLIMDRVAASAAQPQPRS